LVSDNFHTKFLKFGIGGLEPKFGAKYIILIFKYCLHICCDLYYFLSKNYFATKQNTKNIKKQKQTTMTSNYDISSVVNDNGNNKDGSNTPEVILVSPDGDDNAGDNNNDNNNDIEDVTDGDAGKKRGSGFTKTEDLLICKAWVSASEDSQTGSYQKLNVFKNKMWSCYVRLLEEQERMDVIRMRGNIMEKIVPIYDRRNGNTLHCCFTATLSLRCSKFLGVEETTPMESGWNADMHYYACKEIYESRYPRLGNPDDFRLCYDYLQSKPKWHSYCLSQSVLSDKEKATTCPNGQRKDKVLLKDKEIIKATLEELNISTPVEGVHAYNINSNNVLNDNTKENFYKSATDVMSAYVSSLQEKNDYRTFKYLPSPNKREIAKMKAELLMEELELKKAVLLSKKRKLLEENEGSNDVNHLQNNIDATNSDVDSY
jgi:hypothetical protein